MKVTGQAKPLYNTQRFTVCLALLLCGIAATFTLEGCQMSKVIKKEQILLGDIGKPNFPAKVGAWRLGSEWKTEGQAGGEWSHQVTVAYIHEQDAEKQVAITLTLYRSTDGAKRALKKDLAAVEEHNRHEETKGVGLEALKLFGVSRRQAGVAATYHLVSRVKHPGGLLGEPHSAFWVWRNVFVRVGGGLLEPGLAGIMRAEEADTFLSTLLPDLVKRWEKSRQ
jgi:hypothetical protein